MNGSEVGFHPSVQASVKTSFILRDQVQIHAAIVHHGSTTIKLCVETTTNAQVNIRKRSPYAAPG